MCLQCLPHTYTPARAHTRTPFTEKLRKLYDFPCGRRGVRETRVRARLGLRSLPHERADTHTHTHTASRVYALSFAFTRPPAHADPQSQSYEIIFFIRHCKRDKRITFARDIKKYAPPSRIENESHARRGERARETKGAAEREERRNIFK